MSAKKFDSEKPRMDLLPGIALEEIAKVLAFGAKKYGDHNWLQGMDHSKLIAASLRHKTAYMNGEDLDPESGLPHLAHSACCDMFLLVYNRLGLGNDDRYFKRSKTHTKLLDDLKREEEERKIANFEGFVYPPDLDKLASKRPLKLEAGKRYVRRDGAVTGRLGYQSDFSGNLLDPEYNHIYDMDNCGRYFDSVESFRDLIEEYNEEENSVSKSGAQ